MVKLQSTIRQLPLYLALLIASLAILANSASDWYAYNNPDLAIWLNPFNVEPRLRRAEINLENPEYASEAISTQNDLETGLVHEPYDARLYGLLGLIEELNGSKLGKTQPLFQHALALNKTELRALLRSFAYEASNGLIEPAIGKAELIFRAWPNQWEIIEPYIPALLAEPEGYEIAKKRFSSLPGGPQRMLASLAKTDVGLSIGRRLLLDWQKEGIPELRLPINTIINQLIAKKFYTEAYMLHGLTLSPEEQSEVGLVFNPEFSLDPSGDPFDWRLPRVAGVGFEIVIRPDPKSGSDKFDRALEVKFLNTPSRLSQRLQVIRLPKTKLKWSVTYSTRALHGPNPIQLAIQCLDNSKELQRMALPSDGNSQRTVSTTLNLPKEGCGLQKIVILNDNLVESWQNRYSGSLFLHSVKIEPYG